MADKTLGIGIKIDHAQLQAVKDELNNLKSLIQSVVGGSVGASARGVSNSMVQEVSNATKAIEGEMNRHANEIKQIKKDLAAFQKAQDK